MLGDISQISTRERGKNLWTDDNYDKNNNNGIEIIVKIVNNSNDNIYW